MNKIILNLQPKINKIILTSNTTNKIIYKNQINKEIKLIL